MNIVECDNRLRANDLPKGVPAYFKPGAGEFGAGLLTYCYQGLWTMQLIGLQRVSSSKVVKMLDTDRGNSILKFA